MRFFKEIANEVSLGDYRKKAAMQKAQAQMGAMFTRDPDERAKNLATFNKREAGLNRLKARDEKARTEKQARELADLVARLPELKAEYEAMKAKYKSLGGSDWQYADREQNLTASEREARSMEGPMNNLWRSIQAAEKAQGVTESRSAEDLPMYGAIIHRIMVAHTDVLAKYGPEKIMSAAQDEAEWVGDVEEIGSSDVSISVKRVIQALEEQHGVKEAESSDSELERLKLRQNAEHGRASLKRQAETQARIRELEKQIKDKQGVAEGSEGKTPGVALSKAYKKDFDDKKPGHNKPETALTGTYSKTGKPGGELKKQGVAEGVDDEGSMAKSQLSSLAKKAQALAMQMSPDKQLDAWVQSLITRAETDITDVHDFLGNSTQSVDEAEGNNPPDIINVDVPMLLRVMEFAREDASSDVDLHKVAKRLTQLSADGRTVTIDDYNSIVSDMKSSIEEADMNTGNQGYDNMLAVMKAVDAGQDATFNLNGEPITLEYPEARFLAGKYKAFLRAGRQEEFLKYMDDPVMFDRLMKQLRDLIDKQKNFKGSVPGERGVTGDVPKMESAKPTVKPLPTVAEGYYYCKVSKSAKLIPEGYKKTVDGYITRK